MNQEILATIGGEPITQEEFDLFLQNVPAEQRGYLNHPQARQHYLEQMITMRLFTKEGEELKLEETDEFKKIMEGARKDILSQMAMSEALKGVQVTEEEARAYYEADSSQFMKPETVSAKHILMDSEEKILSVKEEIEKGEKTFEDAAKEYSTCPSNARGGDLGEFGKGQMVAEFEQAAFAGEIGAVIGPVKTQFGYHLIKVEKRSEAAKLSFEEVKERITGGLMQQKQNAAYQAKVKELKAKYMGE